jgi:hypothetical protein
MINMSSRRNTLLAAASAACLAVGVMGSAHAAGTPTFSEFLNAANSLYLINATPPGMTRFTNNGREVTLTDDANGAVAGVFVTAEKQVIISFQGTTGGLNFFVNPTAAATQLITDIDVVINDDFGGKTPAALTTSLSFANSVVSMAEAQGFTLSNIFVTGHSLGGIEAEFVASQTGLGGIGFESTGIADKPAAGATGNNFINTVTFGDPVGNFSSDIQAEQPTAPPFVANGGMAPHFGNIVFLGTSADETTLRDEIEGNEITDLASDLDFIELLLEFHLPGVQAHDTDVTLNPSSNLVDGIGDMKGQIINLENLQIPDVLSAASKAGRQSRG